VVETSKVETSAEQPIICSLASQGDYRLGHQQSTRKKADPVAYTRAMEKELLRSDVV